MKNIAVWVVLSLSILLACASGNNVKREKIKVLKPNIEHEDDKENETIGTAQGDQGGGKNDKEVKDDKSKDEVKDKVVEKEDDNKNKPTGEVKCDDKVKDFFSTFMYTQVAQNGQCAFSPSKEVQCKAVATSTWNPSLQACMPKLGGETELALNPSLSIFHQLNFNIGASSISSLAQITSIAGSSIRLVTKISDGNSESSCTVPESLTCGQDGYVCSQVDPAMTTMTLEKPITMTSTPYSLTAFFQYVVQDQVVSSTNCKVVAFTGLPYKDINCPNNSCLSAPIAVGFSTNELGSNFRADPEQSGGNPQAQPQVSTISPASYLDLPRNIESSPFKFVPQIFNAAGFPQNDIALFVQVDFTTAKSQAAAISGLQANGQMEILFTHTNSARTFRYITSQVKGKYWVGNYTAKDLVNLKVQGTFYFQQADIQRSTVALDLGQITIPQVLAPFCARYTQTSIFPFTYLPQNGVCGLPQENDAWAACICNPKDLGTSWSGSNCQNISSGKLLSAKLLVGNECQNLSQAVYTLTAISQTDKNRCLAAGQFSKYETTSVGPAATSTADFCRAVPRNATCSKPSAGSVQHDFATYKNTLLAKNLFRDGLLEAIDNHEFDPVYGLFFGSSGLMKNCLNGGYAAENLESYNALESVSRDTSCEVAVSWVVPAACRNQGAKLKLTGQNLYLGDDSDNRRLHIGLSTTGSGFWGIKNDTTGYRIILDGMVTNQSDTWSAKTNTIALGNLGYSPSSGINNSNWDYFYIRPIGSTGHYSISYNTRVSASSNVLADFYLCKRTYTTNSNNSLEKWCYKSVNGFCVDLDKNAVPATNANCQWDIIWDSSVPAQ